MLRVSDECLSREREGQACLLSTRTTSVSRGAASVKVGTPGFLSSAFGCLQERSVRGYQLWQFPGALIKWH